MSEMRRIDLKDIASWHGRNAPELASRGVESRLVGPTVGRSKDSAAVEFISPEYLVAATVWDSGESEVITAFVQGDDDPIVTVQDLADSEAIIALIEHIALELTAKRNGD
ncbi:hypothetical protein ACQPYA_07885 [Micromonospora sp. CA-263727]|uniref:hypothetical protein n=1 Tax=Micromonospora sp. CA-263727 TaxID=3239967 RepID=UPI003D926A93